MRLIRPRSPRVLLTSLGITVLLAALVIALGATRLGHDAEAKTLQWRYQQRHVPQPTRVVIATFRSTTFGFQQQWPPPVESIGQTVNQLREAGAAAIVVDVPLTGTSLPTGDAAFVESLGSAGTEAAPVILTRRPYADGHPGKLTPAWVPYAAPTPSAAAAAGSGITNYGGGGAIEAPAGAITGTSDIQVAGTTSDPNVGKDFGTMPDPRRLPFVSTAVSTEPGFDAGAAVTYDLRGGPGHGAGASIPLQVARVLKLPTRSLPDTFQLSWYGPRHTIRYLSADDATYGYSQPRYIKGAVVVLGGDIDSRDTTPTPFSGEMPRSEVQATAIANVIERSWTRTLPAWVGPVLAFAIALLAWALVMCMNSLIGAPLAAAVIVGYGWLASTSVERGVDLPLLAPVISGGSALATVLAIVAALALRERLRIRGLFARYVPADVVRDLVDADDPIRLGGEAREVTVLFSDIRGFTTLSEHVDPEEMVEQLNEYFAAMVQVVGENHGTLDKFLGDGLMAIFGAPTGSGTHAADACRCALRMLAQLEHVNAQRRERDLAPLHVGIGIHTGLAVVGNVGSPLFRVDFTAIGDTVNLASRLEGTTKDLGAEIVISAATATAARGAGLPVEPLGNVVVKGRDGVTEVFALGAPQNANALHTNAS